MDIDRRDFFKGLGKKTAGLASGAAVPSLVYLSSLSEDLKALSQDMNSKLSKVSSEVKEQLQSLHTRLDGAALTMTYQQMQISIIFFLLLFSFAIDAGLTTYLALSLV